MPIPIFPVLSVLLLPLFASAANPNCSGDQIALANIDFNGVRESCVATTSIETGASVRVSGQADVLFASPQVTLGSGFSVDGGSRFRIAMVPSGVSINSTSGNAIAPLPPVATPGAAASTDYQVLAINDLGMHCGDLDTRVSSILPPFNVIHAQVVERGATPRLLGEVDGMTLRYASAFNVFDPALLTEPTLAADGGVFKTNFWDVVNQGAYDSFYPPLITPLSIPVDTGLPMPDVERLFLGDGLLAADQQTMPGLSDPYVVNLPQQFHQFVVDQPLFINFPFGYTVSDVRWFEAAGIPIAAYDDAGRENPYPLMRVLAEDTGGEVVASVDTVVPISGEANCQECHAAEIDGGNGAATQTLVDNDIELAISLHDPQIGSVPAAVSIEFASDINILKLHDYQHGTALIGGTSADIPPGADAFTPVVCQRCHYSPALDLAQLGPLGPTSVFPGDTAANGREQKVNQSMSRVMHGHHAQFTDLFPELPLPTDPQRTADQDVFPVNAFEQDILQRTCYRCHPGQRTECLRGAMFNAGILCQDCHGNMAQVGDDFSRTVSPDSPGTFELASDFYDPESATPRVPWANEPGCGSCHTGDVVSNLAADGDKLAAPDGIRLLQAFRVENSAGGWVAEAKATPIVPVNKRFAEPAAVAGNPGAGNPQLYRVSTGHGGVFCEACHGSTHAEWPNANPLANDNVTSEILQGHTGTIAECTVCHNAAAFEDSGVHELTLDGPHGMHAVASTHWNDEHKEVFEHSPAGTCEACHGLSGEGTVLSRTHADRRFECKDEKGSLCTSGDDRIDVARGTPIGCGECHRNEILDDSD